MNDKDKQNEFLKNKVGNRILDKDDSFPKVFVIDTVSYCNLKCSMCTHKTMKRKPGFMSEELYKKIIDEIAEKRPDAQIWITFFGEGVILKDLPEKIAYAREKGLNDIRLNSNAVLLTKEYSKRLIDSGLSLMLVGIDAVNDESYSKIRVGGGKIENVINNVLEYKQLLDKYGKKEQDIVVQFVEMDINKGQTSEFVEFWNKHKIKCKIRPMGSWMGEITAPNQIEGLKRLPCYWGMSTFNIIDTGDVPMCTSDVDCTVNMGNVSEKSIEEI